MWLAGFLSSKIVYKRRKNSVRLEKQTNRTINKMLCGGKFSVSIFFWTGINDK